MRLARLAQGYLAGFGTAGSLLAGAALMFILASALVAFRGWPHVAAAPSPGEVVVSPHASAAAGSLVSRRVALIAAAAPAGAGAGGGGGAAGAPAPGAGGPGGARGATPGGGRHTIGQPASTSIPVQTSNAGAGSAPSCVAGGCGSISAPAPSSSGGSGSLQPVQQAVKQAAGALGNVVSGTGKQVSSSVQQGTGAVAGTIQPASPPAAGAINNAGSGVSKTVTSVTQSVAGALSGLGK